MQQRLVIAAIPKYARQQRQLNCGEYVSQKPHWRCRLIGICCNTSVNACEGKLCSLSQLNYVLLIATRNDLFDVPEKATDGNLGDGEKRNDIYMWFGAVCKKGWAFGITHKEHVLWRQSSIV